jgi:hypothetical protein
MGFLNAQGYEASIDTIWRKQEEILVTEFDAYPFGAHVKRSTSKGCN